MFKYRSFNHCVLFCLLNNKQLKKKNKNKTFPTSLWKFLINKCLLFLTLIFFNHSIFLFFFSFCLTFFVTSFIFFLNLSWSIFCFSLPFLSCVWPFSWPHWPFSSTYFLPVCLLIPFPFPFTFLIYVFLLLIPYFFPFFMFFSFICIFSLYNWPFLRYLIDLSTFLQLISIFTSLSFLLFIFPFTHNLIPYFSLSSCYLLTLPFTHTLFIHLSRYSHLSSTGKHLLQPSNTALYKLDILPFTY